MKIGRVAKWSLRVGAGVLAFVIVATAVTVLMTMFGPVSLSFLSPRLEAMVNAELTGFQVKFQDTTLDWSQDRGQVTLSLVNTTVLDSDGAVLAQAPRVSIALSAGALLQGRAVPRWLTLERPSARLVRTADGQIQFGLVNRRGITKAQTSEAAANEGPLQTALFDRVLEILRHPERGGDLSRRLEGFAIRGASLEVVDARSNTRWAAEDTQFQLSRESGKLIATLKVNAALPGNVQWPVEASADLPADGDAFEVHVHTGEITPSRLASAPGLAPLKAMQFPIQMQAHFLFGAGGVPGPIQIWATAGSGKLAFAGWEAEPGEFGGAEASILFDTSSLRGVLQRLALKGASEGQFAGNFSFSQDGTGATGVYADIRGQGLKLKLPAMFEQPLRLDRLSFKGRMSGSTVQIAEATLNLNTFRIAVSGSIEESRISPRVALDGTFSGLSVADLKSIWPRTAAPNARAWLVDHMKSGLMPSGVIKVALAPDSVVEHTIPDDALTITFDYSNLVADYLDGMPQMTNGRGKALLRGDTFEVSAAEGALGSIAVRNGRVFIPQLHLRGTVAAIGGDVSASMKDILTFLDSPRLGYPKRFGLKPDAVKGAADVNFAFTVPTLKDLKAEEVGIKVTAKTRDLAVVLNENIALDGAFLAVDVTGEGLTATGDSRVNTVPMRLSWTENFKPQGRPSTTIEAEAVLDDAMRERLGLSFHPYVEGPVRANAGFSGSGANLSTATIMLNFDGARISAPELNWAEGPGNKVTATAKLDMRKKAIVMDQLRAVGGDVSVQGRMVVGEGGIRQAEFERVRLGPLNDFSIVSKTPVLGEQRYVVTGRAIDASELLANIDGGEAAKLDVKTRAARPYNISATLQQVTLKGDALLRDVTFRNQTDGIRIRGLDVSANFPGSGTLRADLINLADGQRRLRVAASDAGKLVRAMTGFRSILGGKLTLNADLPRLPATNDVAALASDPPARYMGSVQIENFKVIDQPFLARLFAAGSFTGLGDLLSGEGIAFTKLDTQFTGQGDVIKVADGRVSGTSVGVTFQGRVDRKADNVAFDGTLVPLYGLNSMFEDIPLVGDILTSRKGEGIIGFTYEVAGRTDNLDVMVNPLSMLTPGIFRRIFQAGKYPSDGARPTSAQPPTPQPALQSTDH